MSISTNTHNPRAINDIDRAIGKNMRVIRTLREISLPRLAVQLDLSFQILQRYEVGTSKISSSRLVSLADALDCKITDFFVGIEEPDRESILHKFHTFSDMDILKAYHAITSTRRKRALLRLAKSMVDMEKVEGLPVERADA